MKGFCEADVVVVDGNGKVICGSGPATKEAGLHLNRYRVRPEVRGIVHYHASYATAYAAKGIL